MERQGIIKFAGEDVTIAGPDITVGQQAPGFIANRSDYSSFNALEETAGKVRILAAVPSIDTSICESETIRFEEETDSLGDDIVVLVLSMDLPPALRRFIETFEIENVIMLSDHLQADFAEKYGVLMKEFRMMRRAAFVIDRDGQVVYSGYMASIGNQPDYDQVFKAARESAL